jgi:hypothetical protein
MLYLYNCRLLGVACFRREAYWSTSVVVTNLGSYECQGNGQEGKPSFRKLQGGARWVGVGAYLDICDQSCETWLQQRETCLSLSKPLSDSVSFSATTERETRDRGKV